MKVLIIDSDRAFSRSLAKELENKYLIDIAYTGVDGCSMVSFSPYDLVVVGLFLSDIDGVEVCRMIRKDNPRVPILVLGNHNEVSSKVYCLDCGADDYLSRPFSTDELLARVRALLRRSSDTVIRRQVRASDLIIDLEERRAYWQNKELFLCRKEFELLECLIRNKGRIVPRSKMLLHVWTDECDRTLNCIDVHICRIRRKLRELNSNGEVKNGEVIITVRGLGYKIES